MRSQYSNKTIAYGVAINPIHHDDSPSNKKDLEIILHELEWDSCA